MPKQKKLREGIASVIKYRAFYSRMARWFWSSDRQILRTYRGQEYNSDLSTFYTINENNAVEMGGIDIEDFIKMGRENNILKPFEAVEGFEQL